MHKPKKVKCRITALVIAGVLFAVTGVALVIRPIPYVSLGGMGSYARTPIISVFTGDDPAYIGLLFLFTGCFILAVAHRIKHS